MATAKDATKTKVNMRGPSQKASSRPKSLIKLKNFFIRKSRVVDGSDAADGQTPAAPDGQVSDAASRKRRLGSDRAVRSGLLGHGDAGEPVADAGRTPLPSDAPLAPRSPPTTAAAAVPSAALEAPCGTTRGITVVQGGLTDIHNVVLSTSPPPPPPPLLPPASSTPSPTQRRYYRQQKPRAPPPPPGPPGGGGGGGGHRPPGHRHDSPGRRPLTPPPHLRGLPAPSAARAAANTTTDTADDSSDVGDMRSVAAMTSQMSFTKRSKTPQQTPSSPKDSGGGGGGGRSSLRPNRNSGSDLRRARKLSSSGSGNSLPSQPAASAASSSGGGGVGGGKTTKQKPAPINTNGLGDGDGALPAAPASPSLSTGSGRSTARNSPLLAPTGDHRAGRKRSVPLSEEACISAGLVPFNFRSSSTELDFGEDEAFDIDWNDEDDEEEEEEEEEETGGTLGGGGRSDEETEGEQVTTPTTGDKGIASLTARLRSVDESKAIPKYQRVAMEIFTTEVTYVRRLQMLESFRSKLKEANVIAPDQQAQIFANLEELYKFHHDTLLPQLQGRIDKWDRSPCIGDVMKKLSPYLRMYTPFVKNIENARRVLGSLKQKSPKVAAVLSEFEKSSDCGRIPLSDFMTEPMTRLLRYKLLLGEYLRKLPEGHADREQTEGALDTISGVATHVNETIREEDNKAKMFEIQESVRECGQLVEPSRSFLKEGRLAMVDPTKSRHVERHIFLFNNLLLLCQPPVMGMKYRIVKQMPMKRLKVVREDENHFTVKGRKAVFEFYGGTQREANEWEKAFNDAIVDLQKTEPLQVDEADLEMDIQDELGYRAPKLVRIESSKQCNQCGLGFKSLRRPKCHCYACGQLFCPRCSGRSVPLAYDDWTSRRVCDRCYSSLRNDAVCTSIEDLAQEDWIYGDVLPQPK